MTLRPQSVQPPAVAVWLISIFGVSRETESILGDLLEEFSMLASKSGLTAARAWYWRQTIRTVPRLVSFGLRTAPWMTISVVAAGFFLRKLIAPQVGHATFAFLVKFQPFFEHHFDAYLFFASTGLDIEHLITFLMIGSIMAFASRDREMITTSMLALLFATMAVIGSVYGAMRTGDYALLSRLTWYFADSFAMVLAGAIVKTRRLAARSRWATRGSAARS